MAMLSGLQDVYNRNYDEIVPVSIVGWELISIEGKVTKYCVEIVIPSLHDTPMKVTAVFHDDLNSYMYEELVLSFGIPIEFKYSIWMTLHKRGYL